MANELSLKTSLEDLEQHVLEEDNIDDLQNAIDLFNLNLQKKNIVRNRKLNDLQDIVVEKMYDRVSENAYEFSNSDLIQFHKVIQDTIHKSDNTLDNVKVPTIQVNQQINVNSSGFDRDSKRRIVAAVQSILEKSSLEEIEVSEDDTID